MMRAFGCVLMTVALLVGGGGAAAAQSLEASDRHLAMRLVPESGRPAAGSDVTVAIDTRPDAGWHGYWKNPGDAGFPAKLEWTLPAGVRVSEPAWPVPTTLKISGLMNYVYERPYAPLVRVSIPAGLAAGTRMPVRLTASYLVCTDALCVPEQQTLSLDLVVGDGAPGAEAARFDGWRRAIPRPLDASARYASANGTVRLAVPFPAAAVASDVYFFPAAAGMIDHAAAQQVTRNGDTLVVTTAGRPTGAIAGVLRIGADQGLALTARPGEVAAPDGGSGVLVTALIAFAGAVAGGLILNVMPCVFPILSLKALGLARANASPAAARREALAYTAGVVLVCLALGAAILALRAGGATVGWAFQLQDPRVVLLLLLLGVAIALNLSGLFEMPMPRFAGEGGTTGAFATGALAAFVATPCSGPFMGAALGAALILPWPAALAVFGGLGIGIALPFLLIGFVPALRRRLPRPGAWMARLRRILSVPMWATAWALAWVLGRQAGVDGLSLGLATALAAGLLLWIGGRRQMRGLGFGAAPAVLLVIVAAAGVATVARAPRPSHTSVAGAERFSEARLARLRAEGRPVFAYFTADWCLTCKVNEKAAIETAGVRDAFAARRVAVLVGDWTDGDPALGRFIQAHNRAGVPLYLYYPAGGEPRVLPQVLTPGMLEAL